MGWVQPCFDCDDNSPVFGEAPILMLDLHGGFGGGATTTPILLAIPINPDGTERGSIVYYDMETDSVILAPDAAAPPCCTVSGGL